MLENDENIHPCEGCLDYNPLDSKHSCRSDGGCGRPQNKADRIRAFTDEELARFIVRKSQCPDGYTSVFGPHCVEENGCEQCWLEWLRQEAKEEP